MPGTPMSDVLTRANSPSLRNVIRMPRGRGASNDAAPATSPFVPVVAVVLVDDDMRVIRADRGVHVPGRSASRASRGRDGPAGFQGRVRRSSTGLLAGFFGPIPLLSVRVRTGRLRGTFRIARNRRFGRCLRSHRRHVGPVDPRGNRHGQHDDCRQHGEDSGQSIRSHAGPSHLRCLARSLVRRNGRRAAVMAHSRGRITHAGAQPQLRSLSNVSWRAPARPWISACGIRLGKSLAADWCTG
jgi:hypothetical protein